MSNALQTVKGNSIVQDLPMELVVSRLKEVFRTAIGMENAVNMEKVWHAVYGNMQVNKYQAVYFMARISRGMTALKQRSAFFIVGDTKEGMYQWYVLKTGNELLRYEQQVDSRIRAFKTMKDKARNHVEQKRWQQIE